MSHTVTVKVEYRSLTALAAAVSRLGGQVLGEGEHRLYQGKVTGWGATLPGWKYPIVLTPGGELKYDNYNGAWGDGGLLDRLREAYAVEAAREAAMAMGWMTMDQADGSLLVCHPDGGTLTVRPNGRVEASGFTGGGCVDAAAPIEAAMGAVRERALAPEYWAEHAKVRVGEGG